MNPRKHIEFSKESRCCVDGCKNAADYEVYLYDYYSHQPPEEFYEQDYTCPFICEAHMRENEARIIGERKPRASLSYPFTNQHNAQGFTKYAAISEAYPEFYNSGTLYVPSDIRSTLVEVNDELLQYLAKHPELLRDIHPRKFEEVVASIFENQGFSVELTPPTRDGGCDILATSHSKLGSHLYVVECKRYSSHNKVGIELVQRLHGVAMAKKATKGILATTSTFTKDAVDFAAPLQYQLGLSDYDAIVDWISHHGGKGK